MASGSTSQILQSLVINLTITAAKGVAAVLTGSGALLAETLHTAADCGNQGLLLLGAKRSQRPADTTHPLGYGRELYFWSFIVALLLFAGGGLFSIYEGVHKLREPEPVERVWLGLSILAFSLVLEGAATISNIRELNRRRGAKPFLPFLRETKDLDLVVLFGENSAAVLGLVLAIVALLLAWSTGDGRWDAGGSLAIGVILVGVAFFLAAEVKSLLVGEAADPEIAEAARAAVQASGAFDRVLNLVTVQQGPGEAVVAMKVSLRDNCDRDTICRAINALETDIRARAPQAKWIFVEPDLPR